MTNDKTTHILARLELGFRTNTARLKELDQALAVTLADARNFGRRHASPDGWNSRWNAQWDRTEAILRRISDRVSEMDGAIESHDRERLASALAAWETIQSEDAKMVEALRDLRAQAISLNAAVEEDWNQLARGLAAHLEIVHACAQAMRIKLELLQQHSREDVDLLVRDVLAKLPKGQGADGMTEEDVVQAYRDAATELEREKHKYLGFVDILKGLSMWVESPEERVDKNSPPESNAAHAAS